MTKETKNLLKLLNAMKEQYYNCLKMAEKEKYINRIEYEKGSLHTLSRVIELIESKKFMNEVAKIYGVHLE